jgi:hypothetical protein
MLGRLHAILWQYDPAPLEVFLGGFTSLWGLWVLLPWAPATFAVGPAFRGLVSTGIPEEVWGAVALGLGVLRLWAVAGDVRRVRARLSLGAFVFWLIVSWSLVTNAFTGTGTPIYPWVALACLGVYLRLARAGL